MRLAKALREVEKSNRTFMWVTHPKYPDVYLSLGSTGEWRAFKDKERAVDFTFTIDDLNDYGWNVTYS
jgi:hypothetical protein